MAEGNGAGLIGSGLVADGGTVAHGNHRLAACSQSIIDAGARGAAGNGGGEIPLYHGIPPAKGRRAHAYIHFVSIAFSIPVHSGSLFFITGDKIILPPATVDWGPTARLYSPPPT